MGRGASLAVSRAARGLALAAVLATLPACGGGGGGGSPSEPPQPTPTATPLPAPGVTVTVTTPDGAAITLARGARSTASLLVLEVRAQGVTGLYGAAFDLQYPGALLDYQARVAGSFLGASASVQVFESAPGTLVVGVSRLGNLPGVDGSGVLVELELTPLAPGSGPIGFARNAAFGADGGEIPMGWASGTVSVSP